jgi:hemoglobin/transferrin/lactoferrin receptor protein
MHRYLWSALTLCLLQSTLPAQVLTVKNKIDRRPLEMATIYSLAPALSAFTDAKGRADVSAFAGADSIFIRMIGYEPATYSFQQLEEQDFTVYLEESLFSLDEIVVSAVKWNQYRSQTPHHIVTIRPTSVALQNPQTAADLLGISGQVFIQKSQLGGGSPMIRGFAANRVLIAVDGVRMNNAIFRSGNLQNVISLDPFAVENTEVVFGPNSVVYGSDAIGGVMNFQTIQPKLADSAPILTGGNAVARWSSANDEKTAHADINLGWKKWALVSSLTYSDFGDLRMGDHGPTEYLRPEYVETVNGADRIVSNPDPRVQTPTGYRQLNLMQKVRFVPNKYWDIHYGFHYSATSDFGRYDRLIRYRGSRLRSAEWYYGPQEWLMNNLHILYTDSNALFDNASLTLAHQHFGESRHDRDFGNDIRYNQVEKVNALTANLDFEKNFGNDRGLYYGVEALFNRVGSTGTEENITAGQTIPGPARYPDGARWYSLAAYLNYRWRPLPSLSVTTGLRYNQVLLQAEFDDTFFSFPFTEADLNTGALTGTAGVIWAPADGWQINAGVSTGFRAPNVDDVGKVFDSEPGAVVVPNPDLGPEYAWNGEVGMSRIFGDLLKLDLTFYYSYLDHALVRRDFNLSGQDQILYQGELSQVQAIQNAAFAQVYGLQTTLEIRLPAGFSILSHFNYQQGEEELDDGGTAPLRHAPPWFGATHLNWQRERLRLNFQVVYNGEISNQNLAPSEQSKDYIYAMDENGLPYSPAWYTLNLKAMYQLRDHLSVNVGLENIADQRYRPYSSGIVAPGRNLMSSLRVRF